MFVFYFFKVFSNFSDGIGHKVNKFIVFLRLVVLLFAASVLASTLPSWAPSLSCRLPLPSSAPWRPWKWCKRTSNFNHWNRLHRDVLRNSLDCLLTLSLADFWFHVPLGHDFSNRCTDDSAVRLYSATCTLLDLLFLDTLLVLSAVEHGPLDFAWITLHQEWSLALLVDECEGLQDEKDQ